MFFPIRDTSEIRQFDSEAFAKQGALVYGDAYYYGLARFVAMDRPVTIVCRVHGGFDQTPEEHLVGNGCPKCREAG